MTLLIPVLIFLFLFTLFALVAVYSGRVKKVGPNQVLIISGRGEGRQDAGQMVSKFRQFQVSMLAPSLQPSCPGLAEQ